MSTIRDVAKMAGVSVATVSRVLNSNGYVSAKTQEKVSKVINQLNYKPNEVARSLYKKQSNTVALIVPDIMNPFFPELARAVEDTLNIYGYTLMLCNSDDQVDKEQEYMEMLKQKYIDGAILVSNTLKADEIQKLDLPIVVIDRTIQKEVYTVVSKNYEGARLATQFLKEKGCQVISHLRGPKQAVTANERYQGYMDVVQHESWFHPGLVAFGNYEMKSSVKFTKDLFVMNPEIDGIFAGNDVMGVGAIKAIKQLGKRIPEDVSIVGFDGITLGEMIIPELTTIAQPIYEMGSTGARMLIKQIEKKPLSQKFYEFPIKLVERQTTK